MGVLIEGDPRKGGKLYTMAEVAKATGIAKNTLHSRRKYAGIPASGMYPYAVIKQLVKPVNQRNRPRQGAIDELRAQLRKDGML